MKKLILMTLAAISFSTGAHAMGHDNPYGIAPDYGSYDGGSVGGTGSNSTSGIPTTFTVTASLSFGRINTNLIAGWQQQYVLSHNELGAKVAALQHFACAVDIVQIGGSAIAQDGARAYPGRNVTGVNIRGVTVQAAGYSDILIDGRYCYIRR